MTSLLYLAAWFAFAAAICVALVWAELPTANRRLDALVTSALDGPLDDAMAAACAAESARNSATPIFDGLAVERLWAEMDAHDAADRIGGQR